MAKKKYLVMLTKQYPFGHGEQYVRPELEELSKVYETIYLYPSDYFGKSKDYQNEVPKNVKVVPLNQNLPKVSRRKSLGFVIKAITSEFFKTHSKLWFLKQFKRCFFYTLTQYTESKAIERLLKNEGVDIRETTFYTYWLSASAFVLSILKYNGIIEHYYSKAHSMDLYHEKWGLIDSPSKILYYKNFKWKYVDKIFSISQHGVDFLKSEAKDLDVEVSYLGVNDFGLGPVPKKEDVFTIVTCSNVNENKRVHELGYALSTLNHKVRWIHFGTGAMEDKLLESSNASNIEFDFRGWTPNESVRTYYQNSPIHLFVNLSIVEGLPVSIMEAMSHGIPCVATSVYGTPEAVIDGHNGYLIDVNFTTVELVQAISKVIDNYENYDEAIKLRSNSRELFLKQFNAHKNHAEFANYLVSLP